MAASSTQICNLALSQFGQARINDIDGTDSNSNECKLHYSQSLEELLSEPGVDWTFARTRAELSAEATPSFGWSYSYALPAKFLRLRKHTDQEYYLDGMLYLMQGDRPSYPYTIEGESLLSNKDECYVLYIQSITDPAKFPPMFVRALYMKLASVLAGRMAQNTKRGNELLEIYQTETLPTAIAANGSSDYVEDERGYNSVADAGRS